MTVHPEIKLAQEQLDAAVRKMVEVCALHDDELLQGGATVVGYAMVIEGLCYAEDGQSMTSIGQVYDNGDMRLSAAVGLLQLGLNSLLGIGKFDD